MPTCYIIAGPNGAGKTTFALEFLPAIGCKQFINADLIAAGLSPLDPESISISAGRLFLKQLHEHIDKHESFGLETTLSGLSYLRLLKKLKYLGWQIHLYYLWLPTVDFSVKRVDERVRHGGHLIPEKDIRRRYPKSVFNLMNMYRQHVDLTICLDNSGIHPVTIFQQQDEEIEIYDQQRYENINEVSQ